MKKKVSRQFNISGWKEEEKSRDGVKIWTWRRRQTRTVTVPRSRASHVGRHGEQDSVCRSFISFACRVWEAESRRSTQNEAERFPFPRPRQHTCHAGLEII